MSCQNKYSMDTLSYEQKVYLNDFHNRAFAAMSVGDAVIKQPTVTIIKETPQPKQIVNKNPTQKSREVKSTKSTDIQEEQKQDKSPKIPNPKDRIKIAIVEFQNLNDESKRDSMGAMFSEMLTTSFVGSEAFRITEREQLKKIVQELQLNQSGIIDLSQAKKVGKMVGADAIVTGSVTKMGGDLRLDARIIDVESGIIVTAEKIIGNTDLNSISTMADTIVDNLVNKFYRDKK
jgi:TolB-like protein